MAIFNRLTLYIFICEEVAFSTSSNFRNERLEQLQCSEIADEEDDLWNLWLTA